MNTAIARDLNHNEWRSRVYRPKSSTMGDLLVMLLPLLGLIKVEFVGNLFIHELILLFILPILVLKRGKLLSDKSVLLIVSMGFLWLIAQMITDWIRETPAVDYLRGWAKISLFLISYASLFLLLSNPKRILIWVLMSLAPLLLRPFQLFEYDFNLNVFWKYGMGNAVMLFLCCPFLWKIYKNKDVEKSILWVAGIHILFGFGSFFLNARSLAGTAVLTGLFVYLFGKYRGYLISWKKIVLGFTLAVSLAYLLLSVYAAGAASGFFGTEAQQKFELQNYYQNGPVAILFGGRSEALVSTVAIGDSPIIGHGSWAKDFKYVALLYELRAQYADEVGTIDPDAEDLIPSHSYLFGAWVEAGLAGGLFWITVLLWCFFKVIPAAFLEARWVGMCVVIQLPFFIWNVLFSPFGANVRVEAASVLAIFTILVGMVSNRTRRQPRAFAA